MTTSPDPLAARRDELRALRELHAAAIAARPFVESFGGISNLVGKPAGADAAAELLDRLDAALADAGELLDGVTS